jgi:hypothetical protein
MLSLHQYSCMLILVYIINKEFLTMTRISKQAQRRAVSPRRRRVPGVKTGPKTDNLTSGFKVHENAIDGDRAVTTFIPKIK